MNKRPQRSDGRQLQESDAILYDIGNAPCLAGGERSVKDGGCLLFDHLMQGRSEYVTGFLGQQSRGLER